MPQEIVMEETRSFMKSRVILTAAELDFFTRLDEKPSGAKELAQYLKLDEMATTRVLDCCVTFGLLKKKKTHYHVTEKGAFLSSRNPETVLPMVLHMNHEWTIWSSLTDIVRQGRRAQHEPGLAFSEEWWKAFVGAMHVAARGLSIEIADAYDASRFKRLLDVGGASGTYTIAFLRKNPEMTAVIFDLEDVIPMAEERIKAEALDDRVRFVVGDYYENDLPEGCDFALLSAIIHQNSVEENVNLFRKIHKALLPAGTLLIRDHIMDESRTYPPAGALFAINMLVNTQGGDTYDFRTVKGMLEQAGFKDVKLLRTGEKMDCLVEAHKA
ncbi:MAG: Multifunctional cyclase-dehydratase-3-O-methyl transferase TcmN [Syntrophorhabdus sp. PtaU1.Bin050]|nr:MAG: Multifunctional cyclase-dehydratase-3-O-methyl transferase TcmN [Syntrophorhabdus sp. PtaU1.Bin050]